MKRKIVGVVFGLSALLVVVLFRLDSHVDSMRSPRAPEFAQQADPSVYELIAGVDRRWGKSEGESARHSPIAAWNTDNDRDHQSEVVQHLVESIPSSEIRSTLLDFSGQESAAAVLFLQLLVRRWAEQDPRAAAGWASQHLNSTEAVGQVAVAWAGIDPQAAAAWASSLPERPAREQALLEMAYEVAGTQPTVALGIVSSLAPGTDRDNLLIHAISQWGSTDAQAASAWVQQIRDDALRQRLQGTLAVSRVDEDGVTAAALAANLAPGPEQDRVVVEIVQRWGQTAPGSAGAWIAAFPDTSLRRTALEALLGVWSTQDSAGAASWVRGLAPGPLRDAGLVALADANPALPR